jgi:hypothetical protein
MEDNVWYFKKLTSEEKKLGQIYKQINNIITTFPNNKEIESHADLLFDSVWLGNINAANNLNFLIDNEIKYIINITCDISNKYSFIEYTTFPISDIDACNKNYINIMDKGADIINQAVVKNKPILIHCKRGHHRSASVIAFYLMKYHNISLANAILTIKKIRPKTFRRITCMLKTLIYYEYKNLNSF